MNAEDQYDEIRNYFQDKLDRFGSSPRGADWNSTEAQNTRFEQLIKIIKPDTPYSLLDFGSGYGALSSYLLERNLPFSTYVGYDLLSSVVAKAREEHQGQPGNYLFTDNFDQVPVVDYAVASGVFNIRLDSPYEAWTDYVIETLHLLDSKTKRGFSSNFLTGYSDHDKMKAHLYYADPCFLFDYCKRNFSKNVALLHDYQLYDFTILVRKE